jgi:magnesium/cobalt transport protein CorA
MMTTGTTADKGAAAGRKAPRRTPQRRTEGFKQAKGLRAFLYDAAAQDKEIKLSAARARRLTKNQLLWVDVDSSSKEAVEQLRSLIDLQDEDLTHEERMPLRERGDSFSFAVAALNSHEEDAELVEMTCVVAGRWLVTVHRGPIASIDAYDEHVRADSSLGALDAPTFSTSLLEWQLNEYLLAMEAIQERIGEIEESILSGMLSQSALEALVQLRRRLTYLRGGLTPQRYVYSALAHSGFDVSSGTEAAADFGLLGGRVEQAVQGIDSIREMIVGAFDLYMTRTAQHTNEVMKVLTIVSVLLLPASLLAGIFGMNMLPDAFTHSWFFVVVLALMGAISGGILALLRRRGWL